MRRLAFAWRGATLAVLCARVRAVAAPHTVEAECIALKRAFCDVGKAFRGKLASCAGLPRGDYVASSTSSNSAIAVIILSTGRAQEWEGEKGCDQKW